MIRSRVPTALRRLVPPVRSPITHLFRTPIQRRPAGVIIYDGTIWHGKS